MHKHCEHCQKELALGYGIPYKGNQYVCNKNCRDALDAKYQRIEAVSAILEIVKAKVQAVNTAKRELWDCTRDFEHQIAQLWGLESVELSLEWDDCSKSPFKHCVFEGHGGDCIFCHEPKERK